MASDCPEPEVCRRCRKEGHMVAECPEPGDRLTVPGKFFLQF